MEEVLNGTRITYMGHATFRVVTAGGEQVVVDPFLVDNPQTPDDLKQVEGTARGPGSVARARRSYLWSYAARTKRRHPCHIDRRPNAA